MAPSRDTRVVYGAGVVQGVVLVTFPAASTILTDPSSRCSSWRALGALSFGVARRPGAASLHPPPEPVG